MMCVAMKDFTGAGEDIVRHQLVESSMFRNGEVLIQQRFLRPATEMEIKSARYEGDEAPAPVKKKATSLKAKVVRRK